EVPLSMRQALVCPSASSLVTSSYVCRHRRVDPPFPTRRSSDLLSSKLSTVKAEWDGKDSAGNDYPAEFREIQVEVSVDETSWFQDRKSTRLNSSHVKTSYAVFSLKKKNRKIWPASVRPSQVLAAHTLFPNAAALSRCARC